RREDEEGRAAARLPRERGGAGGRLVTGRQARRVHVGPVARGSAEEGYDHGGQHDDRHGGVPGYRRRGREERQEDRVGEEQVRNGPDPRLDRLAVSRSAPALAPTLPGPPARANGLLTGRRGELQLLFGIVLRPPDTTPRVARRTPCGRLEPGRA